MKRPGYLIIGMLFVLIGVAGLFGPRPALWVLPAALFAFGISGLIASFRKNDEQDRERKFS